MVDFYEPDFYTYNVLVTVQVAISRLGYSTSINILVYK